MIRYDEGSWSLLFAFQFRGSVFPKAFAIAFPAAIATGVLRHVVHEARHNIFKDDLKMNLHQGFTFVLGFLIVFRTQQAYSRWCEGGSLLQQLRGDWFNAFSNLMAFLNHSEEVSQKEVEIFKHSMVRMFSLLYGYGLQQVLEAKHHTLEFFDLTGFDEESISLLTHTHDSCEVILQWIQRAIVEANQKNLIKIAPPILGRVYNQLGVGIVKLNNARQIRQFPVPFPIAQFISLLLMLHWISTVVLCAVMLKSPLLSTFTSFLVIFSFWGVNYIAVELENPYGEDENDLPIRWMQEDLNRSLVALLHKRSLRPPSFSLHLEEDSRDGTMSLQTQKRRISEVEVVMEATPSGPLVDNCLQGDAFAGSGVFGSAVDSSYRDSMAAATSSVVQGMQTSAATTAQNIERVRLEGLEQWGSEAWQRGMLLSEAFNLAPLPTLDAEDASPKEKKKRSARNCKKPRRSLGADSSDDEPPRSRAGGGTPLCGGCCGESEDSGDPTADSDDEDPEAHAALTPAGGERAGARGLRGGTGRRSSAPLEGV